MFGIVKQNEGNVWVYSEPEHGTTFKVYFPAIRDAVLSAETGRVKASFGSETILVAEDDARLRALAQRALEQFGYTVLVAPDEPEAVAVAQTHPGPIHALVTDVVLPTMSGRSLAAKVTEARKGIKVLYVSGYTTDAIVHHGVVDAGIHFLQKPFTPDVLAGRLREVLDTPEIS